MTSLATTVLADSWGWHHGDVGIGWWIVMMLGMVIVGAFVGYQWFMSGLTKIVRGGFVSGLADALREKSEGTRARSTGATNVGSN